MNKKLLALAAGAALLIAAQNSFALPGNLSAGNMSYDITLQDGCTVGFAFGSGFGTYATNSPDISGQPGGFIQIQCPIGLSTIVMVDGGNNATSTDRQMIGATNGGLMRYSLKDMWSLMPVGDANPAIGSGYTPTHMPAPWANGLSGIGNMWYNLVADVFITSSPVADNYHDEVGVTVTW